MRYLGLILIAGVLTTACSVGGSSSPSTVNNGWTWVGGSNNINSLGVYGSLGVADSSNMPGSRTISISWVDESGNFWLFGGQGYATATNSGNLNDLWEYNPNTQQWTWVSGSDTLNEPGVYGVRGTAATANIPGARFGGVSWRDKHNHLWLFGGFGYDRVGVPGVLNDLWEYDLTNNTWTWVSGSDQVGESGNYGTMGIPSPTNRPGARLGNVAWTDNDGNLWLFGGADDLSTLHVYNDIWKFDSNTRMWTWEGGESVADAAGTYGIRGVAATSNQPGARVDAVTWVESNGKLWLYGGSGVDGLGVRALLNDLWRYDPATGIWTWMSGSNFGNQYGSYGTLGIPTQNTIPGGREHRVSLSAAHNQDQFWMFGADGYGGSTKGQLNDLWSFDITSNQWTWLTGANESDAFGIYGSQGNLASSNVPGARIDAIGWVDNQGNLWLFGGSGNSTNNNGLLNDLWKYTN